jgi:hypothetical protein
VVLRAIYQQSLPTDTMFRPTAFRSLQRSVASCNTPMARSAWHGASFRAQLTSKAPPTSTSKRLSLAIRKPMTTSLIRHQSTIDRAAEAEYAKQKLTPTDPEEVTTGSSVRHVTKEVGADDPEPDVDMMAGIRSDFVCPRTCILSPLQGHAKMVKSRKRLWTLSL